jgi:DNA replication protein
MERGFPAGARTIGVPALFFSDVVPAIEDPAELLVSLYAFSSQSRRHSSRRWFGRNDLSAEVALMRALSRLEGPVAAALDRGLALAVARGTLLVAERAAPGHRAYAVNAPGAREALLRAGTVPAGAAADETADGSAPAANIYMLYEQNVGVLSPLLADQLREAEQEYPWPWILAAFKEAVALNRRNWRYIERILARWRAEGPDLEAIGRSVAEGKRPSLAGRYRRLVQH